MRRLLLSCCLVLATVAARAADPGPFTFHRSAPEAQGVSSSALLAFVEAAEQQVDALHSVMVVRHGQVIAEGWWAPYSANERHMLFSLSKSFTSTAVGFAVAEGRLSVDDLVIGFFPEQAPAEPSANLRAMRVRDLLTMSTGQHDEDIRDFPFTANEDLVKRFLAIPVTHKPGTLFVYNTPASYILSAIVQKVTGQPVLEYLKPRLLEPLGIQGATWEASAQGISLGGFGMSVRTEDIARFGQLYLQKGQWQGRPLLPAAWVEAATSRQMSNGSAPTSDWEQGYGYQFWRCRHGFFRGDGAHGQFCIVMPQYDTVVAITSGTRDMASVMNLVWDTLVPALKPSPLPSDPAAGAKLTAKLASLSLRAQTGSPGSPIASAVTGKRYVFGANPSQLQAITLDSLDARGEARFTVRIDGTDQPLAAAPAAWRTGSLTTRGVAEPVATSGAWTTDSSYVLEVVRTRTPFVTTLTLRFAGDQLIVDSETNVGAEDKRKTQLVGRALPAAPTSE